MALSSERVSVRSSWVRLEKATMRGMAADAGTFSRRWAAWTKRANAADLVWVISRLAKDSAEEPVAFNTLYLAKCVFRETRRRYRAFGCQPQAGTEMERSIAQWDRLALAVVIVQYADIEKRHGNPAIEYARFQRKTVGWLEEIASSEPPTVSIWHAGALAVLGCKGEEWSALQWWRWVRRGESIASSCGSGDNEWIIPKNIRKTHLALAKRVTDAWTDAAWRKLAHLALGARDGKNLGDYRGTTLMIQFYEHWSFEKRNGRNVTAAARSCGRVALVGFLGLPKGSWRNWAMKRPYHFDSWRDLWTAKKASWLPGNYASILTQLMVRRMSGFSKGHTLKAAEAFGHISRLVDILPAADLKPVAVQKVRGALRCPDASVLAAALLRRRDLGIPDSVRLDATGHADGEVRQAAILGL